jgi:hypothetical protein
MRSKIKKISLICVLIIPCKLVLSQEAPISSGSYAQDLGSVTAEIRGAQTITDICAENFPALKSKNQIAVNEWRNRYKPFVTEMTSRFEALPMQWATKYSQGAKATPEYWSAFLNKQIDAARSIVKQQFKALEPEQERLICVNFSQALTSARWDLESFRKNEVATIRRGPN